MRELLVDPGAWVSLVTLAAMEIVLGIDNIGVMLVAEATGRHIERGYIYFAMAFSFAVELLNIRAHRSRMAPVRLHGRFEEEKG
ncbi:MAG TPA: hypothetical protein VLD85_14740 [Anaeromyxobacteraceae bacterium]|nr:hypothetical protein [Anaeromyxobacteraceae bacterium]